jgi:hypothetical protein
MTQKTRNNMAQQGTTSSARCHAKQSSDGEREKQHRVEDDVRQDAVDGAEEQCDQR